MKYNLFCYFFNSSHFCVNTFQQTYKLLIFSKKLIILFTYFPFSFFGDDVFKIERHMEI